MNRLNKIFLWFLGPLFPHFSHPKGIFGWIAGVLMATKNKLRNNWIVELLDVQKDDSLLEIGFGPGYAIDVVVRKLETGKVYGVDPSPVMVSMAKRKNKRHLLTEKVELQEASAEHLPFQDDTFHKVYAVNTYHNWNKERALQEIRRVLKPGGKLFIVEQGVPRRPNLALELAPEITESLRQGGFNLEETKENDLPQAKALCWISLKN